ncbi:MAG: AAA family ATPase [Magnetospirillum sp.]|nr:AAA family ATPase [Magnetospirillum sp.]
MRIDRFEVSGLHGIIDANLPFFPDLTIIVGPNGSGKTSVLEFMSKLVRLDMSAVQKIIFSEASLHATDDVIGKILIHARKRKEDCDISIHINDEKAGTLSTSGEEQEVRFVDGRIVHSPLTKASPDWRKKSPLLKRNARVTFVRLDRTITAVDSSGNETFEHTEFRPPHFAPGISTTKDPIDHVIDVMKSNYIAFRRSSNKIQKKAFSDLIKLHFLPATLPNVKATEGQLRQTIAELKTRVKDSHLIASVPECADAIDVFFKQFEQSLNNSKKPGAKPRIGRRTLEEESIEVMIALRNAQITELLKIFEREQNETSAAYSSIKNYMDVASTFLCDSGKELVFAQDTMNLSFIVPGKDTAVGDNSRDINPSDVRSIRELSSGERQIIIALTYLAFRAGENSMFFFDEPELSLHLKWQAQIVEAITRLRPKNCQIVLATHAPEIAGRAREKCIVLNPKYLKSSGI